ncbi:MAG: MFS transporter [Deltaproteobacteria bacterium]|nr:MAG: MFS transporter [Deltaproteobacteria bacterium]
MSQPAPADELAPTGPIASILALDNRFWIVNVMEMLERLAYYGVRAVVPIYMVLATQEGGIELSHAQKGTIFAWWAFVQSMLPMYTGGLADRYGHKNIIGLAIGLKIVGYVLMAYQTSFYGFMVGCLLLAAGTAIFKPGVQGTLAATMPRKHASMGWGIFYQLVNVGGFLGPVLAGVLRLMDWKYVFLICAAIVALNVLWLPFYRSPTEERKLSRAEDGGTEDDAKTRETWGALARSISPASAWFWAAAWTLINLGLSASWLLGWVTISADDYVLLTIMFAIYQLAFYVFAPMKARWFDEGATDPFSVVVVSTVGMFKPRVLFFCLVFAGFWLMFNQVFDLLPNTIDDWVDSSGVIQVLGQAFAIPAIPIVLGAIFAGILGSLCAIAVLLPMRPDRRPPDQVPAGSYLVVALALAGATLPGLWIGESSLGSPLPPFALSALASLGTGGLLAAVAYRSRLPAKILAAVALGVGALGWGGLSVPYLLDSAAGLTAFAESGGQINPEWMINLNPGLIVFTMVFFAWLSSFMRPLTSITLGMVVATAGSLLAGMSSLGWLVLAGIFVFSVGEMLSSPKKMEYLASLSPKGQEGLFMGYANVPVALGWIAGSLFAGNRYDQVGDKVNLARKHLAEQTELTPEAVDALDKTQVLPTLAAELDGTVLEAQRFLFQTYNPWTVWVEIGAIGAVSIVGMIVYDQVLRYVDRERA